MSTNPEPATLNLFVDDVRRAEDHFDNPDEWATARTYNDAIQMMTRFKYGIVTLDHDLGEAKTGYDIMCAIERGEVQQPDDIWCHSYNPVGRAKIEAAIASWKARRDSVSPKGPEHESSLPEEMPEAFLEWLRGVCLQPGAEEGEHSCKYTPNGGYLYVHLAPYLWKALRVSPWASQVLPSPSTGEGIASPSRTPTACILVESEDMPGMHFCQSCDHAGRHHDRATGICSQCVALPPSSPAPETPPDREMRLSEYERLLNSVPTRCTIGELKAYREQVAAARAAVLAPAPALGTTPPASTPRGDAPDSLRVALLDLFAAFGVSAHLCGGDPEKAFPVGDAVAMIAFAAKLKRKAASSASPSEEEQA